MKKVVLDTNVYISAILFGGIPQKIIAFARNKKIIIISSDYILWEIQKVLRDKFNIPNDHLYKIEQDILKLTQLTYVSSKVNKITKDPTDNMILSSAIDGNASFIVTGDKHLLEIGFFKNIKITTPFNFIKRLK
ncbi:putative toxin-antitoxin system toxin component, PIN family [candidate division WOR-1 bacterium RIFOXYD2_FULL_36_8]|uniref:Putative toxin-antitoxin system toxin component, PIN family n=1 Tax=candidate division WOR-1 bacterium RIFOXYB2_FULL_36_35 TaxID=1802578 RepID=A0A1F4S2F9_UNCSA|nr:MAG: putative toxin-antitoxin system toxin component, PIN family [candidate division WOR-1 bacterium RIFOXYA2_FULL_36_21]OGC14559.1 MAG: putative toxin-antitoxin system toxin component, PIN family [candidate division WOR-1 bacterium RIFOXYB2_FULL_36_35]OGC16231.1 MAG: putative toxin-antitoxin system toxin component, PIN family [candidate division WOR-1 bacterium RIFOXYA12_FULL_36_13]OGC38700.1 MAG: putative toxin-antitoxin system toxin component, PIN family [candidate division WOR-1 bacterium